VSISHNTANRLIGILFNSCSSNLFQCLDTGKIILGKRQYRLLPCLIILRLVKVKSELSANKY